MQKHIKQLQIVLKHTWAVLKNKASWRSGWRCFKFGNKSPKQNNNCPLVLQVVRIIGPKCGVFESIRVLNNPILNKKNKTFNI